VLTAELVDFTAEELTQDLGSICAEAPAPQRAENGGALRALTERVGQLEREVVPRERMGRLQKLWTQFATLGGRA